jgi:hypothetical protein
MRPQPGRGFLLPRDDRVSFLSGDPVSVHSPVLLLRGLRTSGVFPATFCFAVCSAPTL